MKNADFDDDETEFRQEIASGLNRLRAEVGPCPHPDQLMAAAAGVLVALAIPRIDPLMGLMTGLKAFVAAVLGGIGNIPGAMLGGMLIGLMETGLGATAYSTYRDAVAFGVLILILLVRPAGILGTAGPEKV